LIVSACATSPSPSIDLDRALHLHNRLSQAIAVEIASRGSGTAAYRTALRPCSGSAILVPGLSGVPTSDLLITLLVDPSRVFDAQLARFPGDPHGMEGGFNGLSILWSTGEIQTTNLPKWITVKPEVVVVEDAPLVGEAPCGPWLKQG
jgi:hypothetical protein